ncbi:MAG: TonB-dependent receptor plug domain-containing protein, partial [Balneolaceae bacterium]
VRSDLNTEINVELREQVFEGEEIVVQAVRDVVIRDLTSSESRVVREDLERLTVQEVSDVVQLQAGVTTGPGGAIHIRGGRSTEIAYVVDGIRVSDDFDRSAGLRIENQSIEEIQVVSGTFNAEFGQATSGIINISTRTGSNTYRGNLRVWGGDYGTDRRNLFAGAPSTVSDSDPLHQYNVEGSFSGPIVKDKLNFFVSGRRFSNDGWLFGRNAFSPQGPIGPTFDPETQQFQWERGFNEVSASNPMNRFGQTVNEELPWIDIVERVNINGEEFIRYTDSGVRDSTLVPLNPFSSTSFQGNLQWNASQMLRFNLIGNYGRESSQGYNHQRRLVSQGISSGNRENFFLNLKGTVTPTANTFLTANIAYRSNEFKSSLFDSPFERGFVNFQRTGSPFVNGRFDRFGTDNNFFSRRTQTITGKLELSSQLNDVHFLKTGIEVQADIMDFQNFSLAPITDGGNVFLPDDLPADKREGPLALELGIPAVDTPGHELWTRKPVLFAAYVQDRIQFSNLTMNIGLRFDYFEPNGRIPAAERPDLTSPFDQRGDDFWRSVDAKWQLSPRFGIAYPISDNGVLHFSYGFFFQVPDYTRLYNGDKLILESQSGVQGIFGNPDLKPERSIKYELGLQQEVFPGTALDVTIFYEDKRDFVSSGPINETSVPSVRFGTWVNRDFAAIRGVTAALNQRVSRRVAFNFDYTFSVAEDSNSDPAAEFFAAVARGDDEGGNLAKFLTPANWDRTHVFNSTLFFEGSDWGFNAVQRFQTGLPYTPSTDLPRRVGIASSGGIITNSVRMPDFFSIDLNFFKNFNFSGYQFRFFANVFNVLDNDNLSFVFNDSGSPERPLQIPAEVDPGFFNNPSFYGEPRRVQLGFQLSF